MTEDFIKYEIEHQKIKKVNDQIFAKYDNADDIINSIEEYEIASEEIGSLIERQMYKHGVYDGMKLILNGIQQN